MTFFNILKAHRVNFVALAIVGAAFFTAYLMHLTLKDHAMWPLLLLAAILGSLFAFAFNYWRYLKISEAPISSIAAAAQGYIELHGVAYTQTSLKTPFQGIPCVWYRAWAFADVKEGSKTPIDIRLLEYLQSDDIFHLKDSSGSCAVNPKGAEIIYAEARTQHKNEHRYVEEYLPAGKPLYVLGHLDSRHELSSPDAIKKDVNKLIGEWKANPTKMLLRFDQDRSGKVDMQEWEQARLEAHREVGIKHQMQAHTQMYTLAKPADNQLFLISALSPHALRMQYQCWIFAHLTILILLLLIYFRLA